MSAVFYPQNIAPAIPLPDAAWTWTYRSPRGYKNEPCHHVYVRQVVGPWPGKDDIGFLSDSCQRCGRVMRSVRDISWRDYFWVRRYNARLVQRTTP